MRNVQFILSVYKIYRTCGNYQYYVEFIFVKI